MYDAIVVGARCAGSPTAMLLARAGRRVLLLDRATFPRDTLSTHYIHQSGVARLARWGLLDRLAATGCPPIRRYTLRRRPVRADGRRRRRSTASTPPTPRAATCSTGCSSTRPCEAGAEVREGVTVEELLIDGRPGRRRPRPHAGRPRARERARS